MKRFPKKRFNIVKRSGRKTEKWYGRTPATVSFDLSMSSDAVRVFSVMALFVFQGNIVAIGLRELGKLCGISAASAMRRVKELEAGGHVRVKRGSNGQRAHYELVSPVFAQKQRAGVEEVVETPSGARRMVSVREERKSVPA